MLTKWPIDSVTDNSAERLKVNLIEPLLDNIICKSNPQNYDFGDLHFGGDERLISRRWLYRINDDIGFRLINSLSVYV